MPAMFDPHGPTLVELAEQALASTRRGYDLLASKFDRTPFRTPDWLLDAVAPHLEGLGAARAVDLCCGTGAAVPLLQRLSRDLVVGVDFSLGMLAETRSGERPRTLFVQQDVLRLGLAERFELATIFGALGHLRPAVQAQFLAQARSCLVPGGTLAFDTAPVPPPWSLSLWLAAAFDATMWLRNRLWRPPFYMYYLAWPLPRALRLLRENGFTPEVRPLGPHRPLSHLRLVLARRV